MRKIILIVIFLLASESLFPTGLDRFKNIKYKYTYNPDVNGIESNPLKGLVPYINSNYNFPYSLEFFYISLKELMFGPNTYNWDILEDNLNQIKSRNNNAIFRVYLDYPAKEIGIPEFILKTGIKTKSYTDFNNVHSISPDWNNEYLINVLENFIIEFGKKYDGDPRIGFITAGLYGFWGEWHTWPYDGWTKEDWQMDEKNKLKLLKAYNNSFNKTHILLRLPNVVSNTNIIEKFGFHDDSFAYQTLNDQEWYFWPIMTQNNMTQQWKYKPIGGEIYPEIQSTIFNSWDNRLNNAQNFEDCVNTLHPTWLMYAKQPTSTNQNNMLRAHKMLGYEFYVSESEVRQLSENKIRIIVRIQNKGIAPFYYNWNAELYAFDKQNNTITKIDNADFHLNDILPFSPPTTIDLTGTIPIAKGSYNLLARIKNPLTDERPLRFANSNQDNTISGYLTLGSFTIN